MKPTTARHLPPAMLSAKVRIRRAGAKCVALHHSGVLHQTATTITGITTPYAKKRAAHARPNDISVALGADTDCLLHRSGGRESRRV